MREPTHQEPRKGEKSSNNNEAKKGSGSTHDAQKRFDHLFALYYPVYLFFRGIQHLQEPVFTSLPAALFDWVRSTSIHSWQNIPLKCALQPTRPQPAHCLVLCSLQWAQIPCPQISQVVKNCSALPHSTQSCIGPNLGISHLFKARAIKGMFIHPITKAKPADTK